MTATVPAWPLYHLVQHDDGTVTISGPTAPQHPHDDESAAVAAVAELAATMGRPVRATATDPDGTTWHLVINPDQTVTETGTTPRPTKPARRTLRPRKNTTTATAAATAGGEAAPQSPAALPAGPPAEEAVPAAPQQTPPLAREPGSPVPNFAAIRSYAEAGDLTKANALADALDEAISAQHGPSHHSTLEVREVRAHLRAEAGDLPAAVTLYRDVAERWLYHGNQTQADTTADRAHALWLKITDPATAVRLADSIVRMRSQIPGPGARAYTAAQQRQATLRAQMP
ncbi:hypothetical protein [Streptomyces luteireticuli]|uniref:Tetratricopeptide repeat protein n=1 Tax=Streptomyces luteireticuli TaxID=173858 RepID=A0ABN0Z8T3_9ACTN